MLSIKASIVWLLLSVLLISGVPYFVFFYDTLFPPKPAISQIVQLSSGGDLLKTYFLAELLDLSCDEPKTIETFDFHKAENALTSCPLIQRASLSFLTPESVIVEYELRSPIAFLGGWRHVAVDREGHLFPFYPFFSPKNLPIVYLEPDNTDSTLTWQSVLEPKTWKKTQGILHEIQQILPTLMVESLDLSAERERSPGRREIVLSLVSIESNQKWIIRLDPDHWQNSLKKLQDTAVFSEQSSVVDLRIKGIAMVTPLS